MPLHPATRCVSVAAVEVAEVTAVGEPPGAVVQRGTESGGVARWGSERVVALVP